MDRVVKLHLGCGDVKFPGWEHVDRVARPHVDYIGDVGDLTNLRTNSLPPLQHQIFGSSVEVIYASHVLQYFDWQEVLKVLKEWHEVLIPGGRLMVAVPNFNYIAAQYAKREISLSQALGSIYGRIGGEDPVYHKMAFDYPTLHLLLRMAGFHRMKAVSVTEFRKETGVGYDYDDCSQNYFSLNVIAQKRIV